MEITFRLWTDGKNTYLLCRETGKTIAVKTIEEALKIVYLTSSD